MLSMMFLAQLIGPSLLVVSASILTRRESMIPLIETMMQNPPLVFVLGIIHFICGLAIVLTQDPSTGLTLPLVLVLLGWWIIARGVLLIFLSQDALWALFDAMELNKYCYASSAAGFILGIYLTYAGFAASFGLTLPFG